MKDKRLKIFSPDEIEQQDHAANLKEAIALLLNLELTFSKIIGEKALEEIESEDEGKGLFPYIERPSLKRLSVENIFKNQLELERSLDPATSTVALANLEKLRIEGTLEKVEQLSDKDYYRQNTTYKFALNYLEYLDKIISGQINETLEDSTEKTFSTTYSPNQLKVLRKALIEKDFIFENISDVDFIQIFTEKSITKDTKSIKWKKPKGKGSLRDLLTILMPGKTIKLGQVAKCFLDSTGKPFEIGKPTLRKGRPCQEPPKGYSKYYKSLQIIIDSIKQ